MDKIKIVRLKTGDDLIGTVTLKDGMVEIHEPMVVDIDYEGRSGADLLMSHWLPYRLIKDKEVQIDKSDVLFIASPDDDFAEYYKHTVEKINKLLNYKAATDQMDEEEMGQVNAAMDQMNSPGCTIH